MFLIGDPGNFQCERNGGKTQYTVNGGYDLCLETELRLETSGKVVEASASVGLSVGDLTDVVEHVAGSEEEDEDERDGGPEIAGLEDGVDVGERDHEESHEADDGRGRDGDFDVVDRSLEGWSWEGAGEPCVDGFGFVDAVGTTQNMISW